PAGGQRAEVLDKVWRAHQLEDHVKWTVLREPLGLDRRRPQLRDLIVDVGVADCGGHPRPGRFGELDRGCAHPSGATVNQQVLAESQIGLGEDRVVRGGEDLRYATGLWPGQV